MFSVSVTPYLCFYSVYYDGFLEAALDIVSDFKGTGEVETSDVLFWIEIESTRSDRR